MAQLLKSADAHAFDCALTDKSVKTLQRMEQIQKDESRKLDFGRKHAIGLPDKPMVNNKFIKIDLTPWFPLRQISAFRPLRVTERSLNVVDSVKTSAVRFFITN